MAADINQIMLTGRLTAQVECKQIGESNLLTGTVASNRSFKSNGDWKEEASFFPFKLWTKTQGQVDFYNKVLHKGAQVSVIGEMIQEKWEKDGEKKSRYVINVTRIIPASSKSEGGSKSEPTSDSVPANDSEFPEDIPF